jgi:hypothetical protein
MVLLDSILEPGASTELAAIESSTSTASDAAFEIDTTFLRSNLMMRSGPVGSRADRLRNTIQPGNFLGRLLDHQAPMLAREAALVAIFDSFAPTLVGDENWDIPLDDDETVELLELRGLNVLRLEYTTLDELRELNHPAIMTVRTERGDIRTVALRTLDERHATLYGVDGEGALKVSIGEVENQWDGAAMIVWEGFERIPSVLLRGQEGNGVVWLQAALGELGVYDGAATGTFDDLTERSVRMLQADAMIEPDGAVGPRTQMVLYNKLQRYDVPRLESKEGAG